MLAGATGSPLSIPRTENKVIWPNESGGSRGQRAKWGSLPPSVCEPGPQLESDSLGRPTIARSSGAAAGRVSNDEALPAVCDSHVQQSVPAARGRVASHTGLLVLLAWAACTAASRAAEWEQPYSDWQVA